MKSIVFYSSQTQITDTHQELTFRDGDKIHSIFVRIEVFDDYIDGALDKANPMNGECVLNSTLFNDLIYKDTKNEG